MEDSAFAAIQIPVFDARSLVRNAPAKLDRPSWPDPVPGVEFVRSVGGIEARPLGPIGGWDGEMAFCRANSMVSVEPQEAAQSPKMALHHRRLFGTEEGYRLDVAFSVKSAHRPLHATFVATALRTLKASVQNEGSAQIERLGPLVARSLAKLTSPSNLHSDASALMLIPCAPAILVEVAVSGLAWPELRALPRFGEGGAAPVFVLRGDQSQRRALRPLRGVLWRLHTEIEFLRAICRLARMRADTVDLRRIVDAVSHMSGPLAHEFRHGIRQAPLLALSAPPHQLGEIVELADLVREESLGLARRLDVAVERAERQHLSILAARGGVTVEHLLSVKTREIVMGDKIRADHGAVVNSRSTVVASFNAVKATDTELASALEQILTVAKSAGGEAVELAEAMVTAASEQKRSIFAAAWDRLKVIVPVLASMATVASTVARFLAS